MKDKDNTKPLVIKKSICKFKIYFINIQIGFYMIITENLQKIKCYYKQEIAGMYEINIRLLNVWIQPIIISLKETGYKKRQQIFTLKQCELIFNHLGHPDALTNKQIHSGRKISIIPFSKKRLAFLYDISSKTLLKQIKSIPDKNIVKEIMQGKDINVWQQKTDKKYFTKNEVELIFKHLGHPYL